MPKAKKLAAKPGNGTSVDSCKRAVANGDQNAAKSRIPKGM